MEVFDYWFKVTVRHRMSLGYILSKKIQILGGEAGGHRTGPWQRVLIGYDSRVIPFRIIIPLASSTRIRYIK